MNKTYENFLIDDLKYFNEISHDDKLFILDCEKKQGVSLYDNANMKNKIDYKPNDLTMEAADLMLFDYFNREISNKTIGIYGTGNIASKLALRLAERNCNIVLFGRNVNKVKVIVDFLKQVTFNPDKIHIGTMNESLDALVSFVSAEQVITEEYLSLMNDGSICLDGGIGNFSRDFIENALNQKIEVRRIDVRYSNDILEGYINSRLNNEFHQIIGRDEYKDVSYVAGGIIGRLNEVVVDRIQNPTKVIGIANGIGGLKSKDEHDESDIERINTIEEFIRENS
ncbi:NAD(P)-dependent oxidoreductase [Abyssicoccus albus]